MHLRAETVGREGLWDHGAEEFGGVVEWEVY